MDLPANTIESNDSHQESQSNQVEFESENDKDASLPGSPTTHDQLSNLNETSTIENDKDASLSGSPINHDRLSNLNEASASENDKDASLSGSPPTQDQLSNLNEASASENDKEINDVQSIGGDEDGPSLVNNSVNLGSGNSMASATFHGSKNVSHIGRKPAFGQSCSMKTLLQDGILHVGEKVLTLEFDDSKFDGDLLKDGTILMRDADGLPHIYATPVAWANHCCKMLNPESRPLNAWSSIRFKGKRLDSYKLKWYRAQKKPNTMSNNSSGMNNIGGVNSNLQGNAAFNNSIIRNSQNLQQNLPHQQGSSRLMIHNPITNYFPQYENPIKNKKLIKSLLISNNMDVDCKRLVAKSLDLSVDPCLISQQMNESNGDLNNISTTTTTNTTSNQDNNNDEAAINNNHCATLKTTVINYEQLGTRGPHNTHNPNTMVKCIPFSAVDRIQPFNVTVSTNALLLIDFHCHLVSGEVAGYLAGSWDFVQQILTVTQAFPCRTSLNDVESASAIEEEIRLDIEKRNLTLVGWYHSHQGKYSNHPTIKDIQNQMDYQITMKEATNGYTPCIGLICSPHDTRSEDDLSPSFQIYWVMPPPEHLPNHYGRPMQMYYSVTRDLFLTQDLLLEMRLLANYYTSRVTEMVDFTSSYKHNCRISNLEKLSGSIKPKLPRDLQESEYPDEPAIWKAAVDHFWKFLRNLVITISDQSEDKQENDQHQEDATDQQAEEMAIDESLEGKLPVEEEGMDEGHDDVDEERVEERDDEGEEVRGEEESQEDFKANSRADVNDDTNGVVNADVDPDAFGDP